VSGAVKNVKQKLKGGSIPKKKAGQLLLQAGQFYNSVNKYVGLRPGSPDTPPAPKVIEQLTQQGTALASEVITVNGTPTTSNLVSASVKANTPLSTGGHITVTVTPTPAPNVPANPNSILSAGQAIINKASSL
jgi:hypothetical protein